MLSIWPFSTPSSLFTIFLAPYVLRSALLSLFQPLLTQYSLSLLSYFFSKIHFILKHHYLNGLFMVFLFLLIINVKQIKIEDCNQHMRKNIQCLLFCIYVISLNIIVSTFTIYLRISSIPFTPSSLNTLVIISYSLTLILTIIYVQNTL